MVASETPRRLRLPGLRGPVRASEDTRDFRWPISLSTDQTARNVMSRLRVQSFAISIDGYGAGPNQDLQNPLGVRGPELMEWFSTHAYGGGCTAMTMESQESITELRSKGLPESVPGFLGATCSVLSEARGRTTAGRAGGATSRR